MKCLFLAAAVVATVALPLAAQAQGVPGGVVYGASQGNRMAGPIGAVVGGAVGGVIGGIEGVMGVTYTQAGPVEAPPPRVRHRRAVRAHVRHSRRRA
jgi:hypothetical protein